MECFRVGPLLDRSPAALGDAERLVLERHLQTCAACARAADTIAVARDLAGCAPSIGPRRHRAALERAFVDAASERRPAPVPVRRVALPALAVAAAAAIAIAWASLSGDSPAATAKAPRELLEVVLAGNVRVGGAALPVRSDVPAETLVSSERGGVLALASARVELAEQSSISWSPRERTVRLESGAVDVYVKPGGGSFRVSAEHFSVEVLGTRFRVESDRVVVHEGVVRIASNDGEVIAAALGEGETWVRRFEEPAVPIPAPEPPPTASALVDRARVALAAGDIARARSLASAAIAQGPPARIAAEADLLLAECAQASGDTDRAVGLYLRVTRAYRNLSAGEVALFAAARLRANEGRRDEARELFETYLERYPRGRLRREAEARLHALAPRGGQR
jgi:hypothetical protein